MARTKREVIKQINKSFDCLIKQRPWDSEKLQAKKIQLLRDFSKTDTETWKIIETICSNFVPEDANTLLIEMSIKGLVTQGIETEEQVSTLLMHLLTPDLPLSEEDLAYCTNLPPTTMQNFIDYIGQENIANMAANNRFILDSREEIINNLLAQIPSGDIYSLFHQDSS